MGGSTSQKRISDPINQCSPMVEAARQRSSSKKKAAAYHSSNEKTNGNQVITVTPFIKMVQVISSSRPSIDVRKNSVTPTNKTAR